MRVLVAYASKTGVTKECAEKLAKYFGGTLCDLEKETPDVSAFDVVLAGANVCKGKLNGALTKFLEANNFALSGKVTAYFMCNALGDEQVPRIFAQGIPAVLRTEAECLISFGGEFRLEGLSFLDKLLAKPLASAAASLPVKPAVREERIDSFIEAVENAIRYA